MTKLNKTEINSSIQPAVVPAFGYELLREDLIPNILGKETAVILYWAGKELARKYPLQNIDDIINFFEKAGWGHLSIKKDEKSEMHVVLESPLVAKRLKEKDTSTFQLEAGFLAKQFEHQKQVVAECYEHPKKRAGKVIFTIKWDNKDPIELDV